MASGFAAREVRGVSLARFVHSGDWQLGMKRRFLGEEAQAIVSTLPPGRGHVVMDTALLPATKRELFDPDPQDYGLL